MDAHHDPTANQEPLPYIYNADGLLVFRVFTYGRHAVEKIAVKPKEQKRRGQNPADPCPRNTVADLRGGYAVVCQFLPALLWRRMTRSGNQARWYAYLGCWRRSEAQRATASTTKPTRATTCNSCASDNHQQADDTLNRRHNTWNGIRDILIILPRARLQRRQASTHVFASICCMYEEDRKFCSTQICRVDCRWRRLLS